MPFTGTDISKTPLSAWDQQLEVTTPYYLSTWLETYDIKVDFTPGKRSGIFKFKYPRDSIGKILLTNMRNGSWKQISERGFTADESFNGMKAYVYGETNYEGKLSDTIFGNRKRQFITFLQSDENPVEFRYSVSFISAVQASESFKEEVFGKSFSEIQNSAKVSWENAVGKIKVTGGTEEQKRTFYTALYRCYERMINITEDNRYYSNYDSVVHESSRNFYVDDWIWDTYLALHPLRTILDPAREADMIQSYVDMYRQSGWFPSFPILWGDNPCMNGFHSTIMVLDAYRKGVRNFDVETAYEGMKKNATSATMLPWRNGPACALDSFYWQKGYFPGLHPGEPETEGLVHPFEKRQSVAVTLGHSYDDWALAQMAKELGKDEDYKVFLQRGESYRNLWDGEKGFFMPKDNKGNWIEIDPAWDGGMGGRDYYDENNGWTYLWQVQQDLPGLVKLMGGKKLFEERLDQFFREGLGRSKYETWARFPDFTGIVGQFSMGNEPSFHIPYLYNLTDSPWKTQKKIRMMLDAWYPDNIFGIPGDEDGGGMSAFVVFSMMGFYPITPGNPVYTIGSPVFKKITIELPSGKSFVIETKKYSEKNKYIQRAWLNGDLLNTPWFTHDDLLKGATLVFEMGPYPSKEWGRGK
jgi:predicted alpha-1,2-mannosidase